MSRNIQAEDTAKGSARTMMAARTRRARGAVLWAVAVVLMLAAAVYQRRTGPTYPVRGAMTTESGPVRYRLPRSQETTAQARVALPRPGPSASGFLSYRRYPTADAFTTVPMQVESSDDGTKLVGLLPVEPAAGKLEYFVDLDTGAGTVRIPDGDSEESTIVLRYKDPVPLAILISHIAIMFFTVLIGMRAGLGALFAPGNLRGLSGVTLGGMTVGGMILGPVVQKYAFGAYWTGVPWGWDLTDNKTLVMWLVWVAAAIVLGLRSKSEGRAGRLAVLTAAVVMTAVYVIPHSLRGSELDYSAVEAGVSATDAVETGR